MTDQQIIGYAKNELPEIDESCWDGNRTQEQDIENATRAAEEALVFARAALKRLKNANILHRGLINRCEAHNERAHEIISNLASVCEEIYELKGSAQREGSLLRRAQAADEADREV